MKIFGKEISREDFEKMELTETKKPFYKKKITIGEAILKIAENQPRFIEIDIHIKK